MTGRNNWVLHGHSVYFLPSSWYIIIELGPRKLRATRVVVFTFVFRVQPGSPLSTPVRSDLQHCSCWACCRVYQKYSIKKWEWSWLCSQEWRHPVWWSWLSHNMVLATMCRALSVGLPAYCPWSTVIKLLTVFVLIMLIVSRYLI